MENCPRDLDQVNTCTFPSGRRRTWWARIDRPRAAHPSCWQRRLGDSYVRGPGLVRCLSRLFALRQLL